MKEYTLKLLDKAQDSIEAAEGLMNMGKAEFSAGRSYYAMFYTAEALLYENGLEFKQHGRSLGHMACTLQKQKFSTRNIIAGWWMDLTHEFPEITVWTLELTMNWSQI